MSAARVISSQSANQNIDLDQLEHLPQNVTLLELVYALGAIIEDDEIVGGTVISMLECGRVQLRGNFRCTPIEDFKI